MSHPPIEIDYAKDYRTINVNGVYGGRRPGYFEAVIYSDQVNPEKALAEIPADPKKTIIIRTLETRLLFTPIQAKVFAKWLSSVIGKYEADFGTIPEPGNKGMDDFR